jgi:uncharacterized membrane protein
MSKNVDFLTSEEEKEIVNAITKAEKVTSGEIRVHIEGTTDKDHFDRAKDLFHELNMDATELQNGVLIYIAVLDKSFIIMGDKGINNLVEDDFWDCTKDVMLKHFKEGDFKTGIVEGVLRSGEVLKEYFPWQEGDIDELSNEISKG